MHTCQNQQLRKHAIITYWSRRYVVELVIDRFCVCSYSSIYMLLLGCLVRNRLRVSIILLDSPTIVVIAVADCREIVDEDRE